MMRALTMLMVASSLVASQPGLAAANARRLQHARGAFTVEMTPAASSPAESLSIYSMNKKISGDITGTSRGQMISGGDPQKGAAGYVAMEVVTASVNGRKGSFALEHLATMDARGQHMTVVVVPGSGTGELAGITGTFTIIFKGERHEYDLAYSLPVAK